MGGNNFDIRAKYIRTYALDTIDLFWEPELSPPDADPEKSFTRANHLAFDIDPQLFDHAVDVLRQNDVTIATEPVTRPTSLSILK